MTSLTFYFSRDIREHGEAALANAKRSYVDTSAEEPQIVTPSFDMPSLCEVELESEGKQLDGFTAVIEFNSATEAAQAQLKITETLSRRGVMSGYELNLAA